jgi:hypothetical protein
LNNVVNGKSGAGAVNVTGSDANMGLKPWLWQVNGGGRIALDKRRHFWVGPTVRFSRDGYRRPTEEFVSQLRILRRSVCAEMWGGLSAGSLLPSRLVDGLQKPSRGPLPADRPPHMRNYL